MCGGSLRKCFGNGRWMIARRLCTEVDAIAKRGREVDVVVQPQPPA